MKYPKIDFPQPYIKVKKAIGMGIVFPFRTLNGFYEVYYERIGKSKFQFKEIIRHDRTKKNR